MLNTFDINLFGYTFAKNPENVAHTLAMKWAFYTSLVANSFCLIFTSADKFLFINLIVSICISFICCFAAVVYFFKFSNLQMNPHLNVSESLKNIVFSIAVAGAFIFVFYGSLAGYEPKVQYSSNGFTVKNFLIFVLINSYLFTGFIARSLSMFTFNAVQLVKGQK